MHHCTIHINHQTDATFFQFIILTVNKRQDNKLKNGYIRLVIYLN